MFLFVDVFCLAVLSLHLFICEWICLFVFMVHVVVMAMFLLWLFFLLILILLVLLQFGLILIVLYFIALVSSLSLFAFPVFLVNGLFTTFPLPRFPFDFCIVIIFSLFFLILFLFASFLLLLGSVSFFFVSPFAVFLFLFFYSQSYFDLCKPAQVRMCARAHSLTFKHHLFAFNECKLHDKNRRIKKSMKDHRSPPPRKNTIEMKK